MSNFRITHGRGFGIGFANGWRVSVQFGPGNYCEHYDADFRDSEKCGEQGSYDAETAVINPDGDPIEHPDYPGSNVQGRMTPEQVLALMNWAAQQGARS